MDKKIFEKSLFQAVREYALFHKVSIRLLNSLGKAESEEVMPFNNVNEYIKSDFDKEEKLLRIDGFGRNQFDSLKRVISEIDSLVKNSKEKNTSINNKEIFETIDIALLGKMFPEHFNYFQSWEFLSQKDNPYRNLNDYISSDFGLANINQKIKFLGQPKRMAYAFRKIIVDPKFKKILEDKEQLKKIQVKNIDDLVEDLNKKYPKVFNPLILEIENSDKKYTYIPLVSKLVGSRDGEYCYRNFLGESLTSIGEMASPPLSKERIRQIVKKYEYYITKINYEYLDKLLKSQSKNNLLPPNSTILNFDRSIRVALGRILGLHGDLKEITFHKRIKLAQFFKFDVEAEELATTNRWSKARLINELRDFAKFLGKPHLMPKQNEMMEHDRADLRAAVVKHGGGQYLASKLAGLKYQGQLVNEDGTRTYWTEDRINDFLWDVAEKTGRPGMMPSREDCLKYTVHGTAFLSAILREQKKEEKRSWLDAALDYGLKFDKKYTRKNLDINYIKTFVKSLGDAINYLTPSEVFVLYQQAAVKGSERMDKVFEKLLDAIQSGNLPKEELEKWVTNDDSNLIDNLIDPTVKTVKEAFELSGKKLKESKFKSKAALDKDDYLEAIDEKPPAPKVIEALQSLGVAAKVLSSFSSDTEAINFFIAKATGKLWKRCFENESEAIEEARTYKTDNEYERTARDEFIDEYSKSKQLPIPEGYDFRDDDGNLAYPNLMQKLIAYRVLKKERVLNLSGTGTGKTLSAIVASRVIGSKLTVISCPNNTTKGWAREIKKAFPDSIIHHESLKTNTLNLNHFNYFILNHEYFQSRKETEVKSFINKYPIDFIVIDEIHRAKQRDEMAESQRRRILTGLITDTPEGRHKPRVLGLSATPVINNIFEGKSLIELVTSQDHSEIGNKTNLENCMRVYQKFITLGFRKTSDYKTDRLPTIHPIDCSFYLPELLSLGSKNSHPQKIESILIKSKWSAIEKCLKKPKTVVFIDYVTGIVDYLREKIIAAGYSVGVFTGTEKHSTSIDYEDALDQFINGPTEVLLASIKTVATGVDGLQKVCNNVVFAHLPWTNTEYEQAIGRFDRQGSKFETLDIHIPRTFAELDSGEEWSWCQAKLNRIQTKKDVANAAVDGEIPDDTKQLTPEKASSYWMEWLERLNEEGLREFDRAELKVPLDESNEEDNQRRYANYGDFAHMNSIWNRSLSATTHERLKRNPEEWYYYHTEAKKKEAGWQVVPRDEIIKELPHNIPTGGTIADYGCGLAEIQKELGEKYKVFSLDHVAIDDDVIECDMADSPLQDNSVDAAVFSLSLMGKNIKDYIGDAHRVLENGGQLVVYHPAKSNNRQKFIEGIEANGFVVIKQGEIYKWHYIWAIKQAVKKDPDQPISF